MTVSITSGIVRGRTIVLAGDAPGLPEGTEVLVIPCIPSTRGSDIVAALNAVPPATAGDAAELERTIAAGWQPMERGSPAFVLAAMDAEPHLSDEDVDALERSIEEGRRMRK